MSDTGPFRHGDGCPDQPTGKLTAACNCGQREAVEKLMARPANGADVTDPLHRASWLEGRLMSLRRLRHWAGTHQPNNTALLDRIDQQTTLAEKDLHALNGDQDGTP